MDAIVPTGTSCLSVQLFELRHLIDQAPGGDAIAVEKLASALKTPEIRDILRNPLRKRTKDSGARASLTSSPSVPAPLQNLATSLSDQLNLHEDDALRYLKEGMIAPNAIRDDVYFLPSMLPLQAAKRVLAFERRQALEVIQSLLSLRKMIHEDRIPDKLKATLLNIEMCASLLCIFRADGVYTTMARNICDGIVDITTEMRIQWSNEDYDDFLRTAAVEDRLLAARCLFLLYQSTHITVSDPNTTSSAAETTTHGILRHDPSGGELVALIKTVHAVSDELYACMDHSHDNPLFQLCALLIFAFSAALDSSVLKYDTGMEGADAEPALQHYSWHYATMVASPKEKLRGVVQAALACNPHGTHPSWSHTAVQASMCMFMGNWYYSMYRMIMCSEGGRPVMETDRHFEQESAGDDDDALAENARKFNRFPPTLDQPRNLYVTDEQNKEIRDDMRAYFSLAKRNRALQLLYRSLAMPSFSSFRWTLEAVRTIHKHLAEFVRFHNSYEGREAHILQLSRLRARNIFRFTRTKKDTLDQVPPLQIPLGGMQASDTLEDLLVLFSQLARADPSLACTFWCTFGSAADPYGLDYLADRSGSAGVAEQVLLSHPSGYAASIGDAGVGVGVGEIQEGVLDPYAFVRAVLLRLKLDETQLRIDIERTVSAYVGYSPSSSFSERGGRIFGDELAAERSQVNLQDRFIAKETLAKASAGLSAPKIPDSVMKAIIEERAIFFEFSASVLDFLAAIGTGPLCADGRTCPDHLMSMLDAEYHRNRVRDLQGAIAAAMENTSIMPAADVEQEDHPCTIQNLIASLSATSCDLDPAIIQTRTEHYELTKAYLLYQEHKQRAEAADLATLYGDYGVASGSQQSSIPEPPVPAPLPSEVLGAQLRLIATLCGDPLTRNYLSSYNFALPEAEAEAALAEQELRQVSSQLPSETRNPKARLEAFVRAMEMANAAKLVQQYPFNSAPESEQPTTKLLWILLQLVRLQVPTSVKAGCFTIFTRLASIPSDAALIRDALELQQILQTVPLSLLSSVPQGLLPLQAYLGRSGVFSYQDPRLAMQGGVVQELESVETSDANYDSTLAFCNLLRQIFITVPTYYLGSTISADGTRAYHRSPGMEPHMQFIIKHVLMRAKRRPTKVDRSGDRYKLVFVGLAFLFEVLRRYAVHAEAPSEQPPIVSTGKADASKTLPSELQQFYSSLRRAEAPKSQGAVARVPGDAAYDFAPPQFIEIEGASESVPLPKSLGYELMRQLLSGGELFGLLVELITCDGKTMTSLASAKQTAVDCCSPPAFQDRQTKVETLAEQVKNLADAATSMKTDAKTSAKYLGLQATKASTLGIAHVSGLDAVVKKECEVTAVKASRDYVQASVSGTGAHDPASLWQEKCVTLALLIVDSVLAKDTDFINASHKAGVPDVLSRCAELLRRQGAIPHIALWTAYENCPDIGMVASRVLYKLAVGNAQTLPPTTLLQSIFLAGEAASASVREQIAGLFYQYSPSDFDIEASDGAYRDSRQRLIETAELVYSGSIQNHGLAATMQRTQGAPSFQREAAAVAREADSAIAYLLPVIDPTYPLSGHLVTVGGVQLPLTVDDAPFGRAYGIGRAIPTDYADRLDIHAIPLRRGILLDIIRACVNVHPVASRGVSAGQLSGRMATLKGRSTPPHGMTLGHFLLGLPQSLFDATATSTRVRKDAKLLKLLLRYLTDDVDNFAHVEEGVLAAKILHSLMRNPQTSMFVLRIIDEQCPPTASTRDAMFMRLLFRLMASKKIHPGSDAIALSSTPLSAQESAYVTDLTLLPIASRHAIALRRVLSSLFECAALELMSSVGSDFATAAAMKNNLDALCPQLLRVLPLGDAPSLATPPLLADTLTQIEDVLQPAGAVAAVQGDESVESSFGRMLTFGGRTFQTYGVDVVRKAASLTTSGDMIDVAGRTQLRDWLGWTRAHNQYCYGLQSATNVVESWANLLQAVIHHSFPLSNTDTRRVADAPDLQEQRAAFDVLRGITDDIFRVLKDHAEDTPSFLCQSICDVLLTTLVRMRIFCPSVVPSEQQALHFVRSINELVASRSASVADRIAPEAAVSLRCTLYACWFAYIQYACGHSMDFTNLPKVLQRTILPQHGDVFAEASRYEAALPVVSRADRYPCIQGVIRAMEEAIAVSFVLSVIRDAVDGTGAWRSFSLMLLSRLFSPLFSHTETSVMGFSQHRHDAVLAAAHISNLCPDSLSEQTAVDLVPAVVEAVEHDCVNTDPENQVLATKMHDVQSRWLDRIYERGCLKQLISLLLSLDAEENEATNFLYGERSRRAKQTSTQTGVSGVVRRAVDGIVAARNANNGKKRLKLLDGDAASMPDGGDATADRESVVEALQRDLLANTSAYQYLLEVLAIVSTYPQGSDWLSSHGILATMMQLQWITRAQDALVGIRALASSGSFGVAAPLDPTAISLLCLNLGAVEDGTMTGTAVSGAADRPSSQSQTTLPHNVVAAGAMAPRLLSCVYLLVNLQNRSPKSLPLAAAIFRWVRFSYHLFDIAFAAAAEAPTTIACLQLARGYLVLLERLSSVPHALEDSMSSNDSLLTPADGAIHSQSLVAKTISGHGLVRPSTALDAAGIDLLVLHLFTRFWQQVRADPDAQQQLHAASRTEIVAAPNKMLALMGASQASKQAKLPSSAWYANVLATTADEIRALRTPLAKDSPSRIGAEFGRNAFELAVVTAGERLLSSCAMYLRSRVTPISSHASMPVLLFRAPDEAATEAGAVTLGKPSIKLLLEALESASHSLRHARWQRNQACQKLKGAMTLPPAQRYRALVIAITAMQSAQSSVDTCLVAVENMLTIWYMHSAVDPSLRFSEDDINKITAHEHLREALETSHFTRALIRQLKQLGGPTMF